MENGKQETGNWKCNESEARIAMKGDDIAARLVALGVRVITILDALPQTAAGRHVAGQLLRSGISAGANYVARRAGRTLFIR